MSRKSPTRRASPRRRSLKRASPKRRTPRRRGGGEDDQMDSAERRAAERKARREALRAETNRMLAEADAKLANRKSVSKSNASPEFPQPGAWRGSIAKRGHVTTPARSRASRPDIALPDDTMVFRAKTTKKVGFQSGYSLKETTGMRYGNESRLSIPDSLCAEMFPKRKRYPADMASYKQCQEFEEVLDNFKISTTEQWIARSDRLKERMNPRDFENVQFMARFLGYTPSGTKNRLSDKIYMARIE